MRVAFFIHSDQTTSKHLHLLYVFSLMLGAVVKAFGCVRCNFFCWILSNSSYV